MLSSPVLSLTLGTEEGKEQCHKMPQTPLRSSLTITEHKILATSEENDYLTLHSIQMGLSCQGLTTVLGTIPILWSWAMKIQEEELLPNEWQKRMIRRCDQSLVGPAIYQHPLQGWDDGQLQLDLGLLQESRALATPKQVQSKSLCPF